MTNYDLNKFLDLDFYGCNTHRRGSKNDVSVSKNKHGWSFSFRNGVAKKIGDRIMFAIKGDYMFFKTDKAGWALTQNKATTAETSYMKVKDSCVPNLDDFIGDYDLKYMEPIGMYYIQKEA